MYTYMHVYSAHVHCTHINTLSCQNIHTYRLHMYHLHMYHLHMYHLHMYRLHMYHLGTVFDNGIPMFIQYTIRKHTCTSHSNSSAFTCAHANTWLPHTHTCTYSTCWRIAQTTEPCRNVRVRLETWSFTTQLVIISFFFWSEGYCLNK